MDQVIDLFHAFMPSMPPGAWWVSVFVLIVLGAAAIIDALKAIVPDPLIFIGAIILIGAQGIYVDWPWASHQLAWGLGFAVIIWGINEGWYRLRKQDAIGMGDAKWSILSIAAFGLLASLIAWAVGAVLALLWMGALKIARRPIKQVHFAPFLMIGLLIGLWVLYLSPQTFSPS